MEIRQLEYFLAVSDTGSFTRAAERLYVSQPAVTNAIRSLEEELGIQLFDRNQKLASLTAEGQIFDTHVEQVMHGISKTIEEIDAMKNFAGGVLRLGLTALGGIKDIAEIIKIFNEQYSAIKINVTEASSDVLVRKLIDDQIDIAILSEIGESSTLTYLDLPEQELFLLCGRQHRFRRLNSVKIADLANEPLILPVTKCQYRQKLMAAFKAAEIMPQIAIEVDHVQTLKSLLASINGVTILPESLSEDDDRLVSMAISPALYMQPVVAYKTNRHLSHAAEAFLACVKKGQEVQ